MLSNESTSSHNISTGEQYSQGRRLKAEGRSRAKWTCLLVMLLLIFPEAGSGMESCCPPPSPEASSSLLSVGIEGYQKFLSPVLDSQCYMLPSCSAYSKQAMSEYGPLLGLLLTIDRLFHEANEDQTSPLVRQGNNVKLYDPPSANVWWKK